MYVNPQDDKAKQLHPDIGRTLPQEKLKLGQKMKSGGKAKPVPEFLKKEAEQERKRKELIKKLKKQEKNLKDLEKVSPIGAAKRRRDIFKQREAKSGGQIKKYSYRRGGLTTLRKPKRG